MLLLGVVAAVEVAVEIEMVVYRGKHRSEYLQGLDVPEPRHRTLSSSNGLMRVFGPIVEPTTALLSRGVADHFHRRAV